MTKWNLSTPVRSGLPTLWADFPTPRAAEKGAYGGAEVAFSEQCNQVRARVYDAADETDGDVLLVDVLDPSSPASWLLAIEAALLSLEDSDVDDLTPPTLGEVAAALGLAEKGMTVGELRKARRW